ncbi:uncharacterized protein LOC124419980 isoform X3 [Lucilia cuprina]|uniref:uncharacterized protein LOC124419980 isoform X3 n=1 Tax=Lucilia cuprina TaxID=7375 RepID=UPI001F052C84|nr:uncharacterized protein LOC124419980 isoform X3 [Lucilia cuprina]
MLIRLDIQYVDNLTSNIYNCIKLFTFELLHFILDMYPLVLIKSFGKEKNDDIINELLNVNGEINLEPMSISVDSYDIKSHKLSICTKYYKTQVYLFECEDINEIPDAIKKDIEGVIFYFDSNDVSTISHFLSELASLLEFVKDNNIGVSALITRNLSENNSQELTFDEIRDICKLDINIIDLNAKMDNEEADGYAEVIELLKNHLWSNVHIPNHNSNTIRATTLP